MEVKINAKFKRLFKRSPAHKQLKMIKLIDTPANLIKLLPEVECEHVKSTMKELIAELKGAELDRRREG